MVAIDEKFASIFGLPVNTFERVVPLDYVHKTQLKRFKKKYKGYFTTETRSLSDRWSGKTSAVLLPGKNYEVSFYPILQTMYAARGIEFLQAKQIAFVGPQGISLFWDIAKDLFPKDNIYALDVPEHCAYDMLSGGRRMNYVVHFNDGKIPTFYYTPFGALFQGGFLLGVQQKM